MQILVIDIGGTDIKYAVMDEKREILERGVQKTPYERGVEGFLETLVCIYDNYRGKVEGISLSLPGVIDSNRGFCISGGSLTYNYGQPIKQMLKERTGAKVYIENDGKCAALAEFWCGALKGCKNGMIYVVGTAVAGGIILNGQLLKGHHFSAGELSYMNYDPAKWEDLNGMVAFQSGAVQMIKRIKEKKGIQDDAFDGMQAFDLIHKKDEVAVFEFKDYTRAIAIQLYNLQMLLDLEIIAIGGGISKQDLFIEEIRNSIEEIYETNPAKAFNPELPKPQVERCAFSSDSNLIGALYHYLQMEQ